MAKCEGKKVRVCVCVLTYFKQIKKKVEERGSNIESETEREEGAVGKKQREIKI